MTAIFGLFRRDGGRVEPAPLQRMSALQCRRGDAASLLEPETFLGLGCRVGSVAGSPAAAADLSTGAVVVADARIDNRDELARLLGLSPSDALSAPELILATYLRWGAACPEYLVGDFSFAIWDPRIGSLFAARDPMGVRPFYYHASPRLFAFATEIKGLRALSEVPRELDPEQVALFLAGLDAARDRTLFASISRLPAAHTLSLSADGAPVLRRYWSPDSGAEYRFSSEEDYVESFGNLLTEAVRCRLDGDRAIATALSGGLDSSAITCLARNELGEASGDLLNGISLIFPDLAPDDLRVIDERSYVERVVEGGGLRWHPVRGDRVSPLGDLDPVLNSLDLPFAAPNLYLHWAMYGAARAAGASVFLDGLDGDTTVSHGFGRLNALLRARDWDAFEREIRGFARHRAIAAEGVLPHFGFPYLGELAGDGSWRTWGAAAWQLSRRFSVARSSIVLEHGLGAAIRSIGGAKGERSSRSGSISLLRSGLAGLVREQDRLHAAPPASDERSAHLAGLAQPAYQTTLEMANACAATFGVEPRYPFFDRRLIEFCVAVPEELKFANGWGRLIFRRAMEGVLPPEIQWRTTKANLSPNFQRQFTARDRQLVDNADLQLLSDYLDVDRLERVRAEYFAEERGWGDPDAFLLLRATTLARWLADGSSNESSAPPVHACAA